MDTVTQALLGAAVAQAGFRRKLGRGAIAAGALIGTIPDLDVVAGMVGGPMGTWLHHRGITHSLLFGPVIGPLLGWAIWKWRMRRVPTPDPETALDALRAWIYLSVLVLLTHPLIDLFTSYGTQILAPFSNHRFSINAMPIVEPYYTLGLLIAVVVGVWAKYRPRLAQDVAAASLVYVGVYTLAGWAINERAIAAARTELGPGANVRAYPNILKVYDQQLVAETDDAFLLGQYSLLDPNPIAWSVVPKGKDPRIEAVRQTREAKVYEWFSMGNVRWSIEEQEDGNAVVIGSDVARDWSGAIRATVGRDGSLQGPVELPGR